MIKKRTNFRKMFYSDFIEYLTNNDIPYKEVKKGDKIEVVPNHNRLKSRSFLLPIGKIDNKLKIDKIIKTISERIEAMSTKGVYHPKRIRPKWKALQTTQDKIEYFEKMVSHKESSIGFRKLVSVNLCHKTLEAIIIENPDLAEIFKTENLFDICVSKFQRYENGISYLIKRGILISGINSLKS